MEEEQRKKNLELMRANFEPEVTNEDLERGERELAGQEEAVVVYALFSLLSHQHLPSNHLPNPNLRPGLFGNWNPRKRKERYQHHLSQTTGLSSPTKRSRPNLPLKPYPVRPSPHSLPQSNPLRPRQQWQPSRMVAYLMNMNIR